MTHRQSFSKTSKTFAGKLYKTSGFNSPRKQHIAKRALGSTRNSLSRDVRRRAEHEAHLNPSNISAILGDQFAQHKKTVSGTGKPLSAILRSVYENRYGVDLSKVRIHDDAEARKATRDQGANAFSEGDDIVLGENAKPGTKDGDRILNHEIIHAAQQAKPGASKALFKDTGSPGGIGRRPPSERFTRGTGSGVEDGHILFGNDNAALNEAMRSSIRQTLGDMSEPMTVHLHGYADPSGSNEYNYNLSAHRAVAVKLFLESILPQDSHVVAFAYGETSEFGSDAENNRRTGINVVRRGSLAGFTTRISLIPNLRLGLGLVSIPGLTPGALLTPGASSLTPLSTTLTPGSLAPGPLAPESTTLPTFSTALLAPGRFNPGAIAPLYSARGLSYSQRDMQSYEEHFNFTRDNFIRLGLSWSLSVWLAQKGTQAAAATVLSLEHPNQIELLDRQFGTEPSILPIPVLEF